MMDLKLYELSDAYLRLADLMSEDEDGDWEKALATIEGEFEEKVDSVARVIRSFEVESKAYQEEAKRLGEKASAAASRAVSLKGYLLREMLVIGKDRVQGRLFKVSAVNSPPSCEVLNEEDVPLEYRRFIPARWEVDKRAILDAWREDGSVVSGVRIVDDRKHLLIK